jgi:hypothetical protein
MGTIMTLYDVAFSYFLHRVSGVFAQAFIISSVFSLGFLKIIFILHDIQVLKGECYNTKSCDHLRQEPGTTVAPVTIASVNARHP